nr:MAG TPA: large terminase protein [Caudoviricetes sp.]
MGSTKQTKQFYLNNPNIPAKNAELEGTEAEWIERAKEIKKCKNNIFYFAKHYIYILNPDRGRELVKLYGYQKRMLKKIVDNRFAIFNTSRQIGKSMLISIYAVWYLCFHEDKSILLAADKEATAIEIFGKVKLAYESLPNWLKPGAIEFSKTKMNFDNGCRMQVTTTTENTGRGFSINVLLLDEFAFVAPEVAEAFFTAILPTISASKSSKVIITSTPNGVGNLFYRLFTQAQEGKNSYVWDTVLWSDVPGRDEKFKEDQISQMGYKKFAQEYEAQFISDANSFLPEEIYQQFRMNSKPALLVFEQGKYQVWKEYNKNHIYCMGVDTAEGVGRDKSVIVVFDITNLEAIEQVATYCSDEISPYNFTSKCYEIACQWGAPNMVVERNNQGAQVVDGLYNKYHYPNIISYGHGITNRRSNFVGVLSHTNVKLQAITNFRYWLVERQCLKLNDIKSIEQFKEFVQHPNGTWAAIKGDNHHDDYIMAMVWALFVLHEGIVEKLYNIIDVDTNKRPLIISTTQTGQTPHFELGYNGDNMPMFFGGYTPNNIDGISELVDLGYKPYSPGRY